MNVYSSRTSVAIFPKAIVVELSSLRGMKETNLLCYHFFNQCYKKQ